MERAHWEEHLKNCQKGVEVATDALDKIDSQEEITNATLLIIGALGEGTARVRAEADFRWLIDAQVDKGLLTHREAYDAMKAYQDYLSSPDGTPRAAPSSHPQ